MKLLAYAGFRSDNGRLVETRMHDHGDSPCIRIMTEDRVRVRPSSPFSLEVKDRAPSGILGSWNHERRLQDELLKFAVILIDAGLTPEQLKKLQENECKIELLPRS